MNATSCVDIDVATGGRGGVGTIDNRLNWPVENDRSKGGEGGLVHGWRGNVAVSRIYWELWARDHRELDNLIMRREMTIAWYNTKLRKMTGGEDDLEEPRARYRKSVCVCVCLRKEGGGWRKLGKLGKADKEGLRRRITIFQPLSKYEALFFFFINIWERDGFFFFFFFWTNKLLTLGWNSLTNPYTVRSQQSYAIQSLLIINSKLLGERCLKITLNNVSIEEKMMRFFLLFHLRPIENIYKNIRRIIVRFEFLS